MITNKDSQILKNSDDLHSLYQSIVQSKEYSNEKIYVCAGGGCIATGSLKVKEALAVQLKKAKLLEQVSIIETGCLGPCAIGPVMVIGKDNTFYQHVKPDDTADIVQKHILKGQVIEHLLHPVNGHLVSKQSELPFFKHQTKLVLKNCGKIDPKKIEDYIAAGGYQAMSKALTTMNSDQIIAEVTLSVLRGRGGGGFPTGTKWNFTKNNPDPVKYILCNADEGDPGAFMDRSILEGDPHSVIEGMIIGALAIGSHQGYVYVRAEYPLAIERLQLAIEQAREYGLLGPNILGSDFDFDLEIRKGSGAFVCGEETALMTSIEGNRGEPRPRPPYPAEKGLWKKPTVLNNVETFSNIPHIINMGGAEYAKTGTEKSKGTKIFALAGTVHISGLVEVAVGTPLRKLIYDIGGGISTGKQFKAAQIGGPSGGCIPAKHLDVPLDYDALNKLGAIMGSGGLIVMDETSCMVDVARFFLDFVQEESCGKCVPCREGTARMLMLLEKICNNKGEMSDMDELKTLAETVSYASLCGLGQTASNPVLATIRYFMKEYEEHIIKKKCEAGTCKEIVSSPCQHSCPINTEASLYIGYIAQGKYEEALKIIKKDNPLASALSRVCHHPCESKCKAEQGGEPIAIRNLKRFATDYGLKHNLMTKVNSPMKSNGTKVAIIGSGPAGLTCGFYLATMGYETTIFEKESVAGGMLALGVPEYRLPRKIINADIDYIKSAGVQIKTNAALGKDFTLDDLFKQGFKSIFIATGAYNSLKLGLPNEDMQGIIPGMKLLKEINLGKLVQTGKKIGVIGGGNSAVDAARSLLRLGKAESITIFYRRTIDEMPAYKEEIDDAVQEGIKIEFLTAPVKLIEKNGKLNACEFIRMKMGDYDDSGRRKPEPIEKSEFTVELDTLIVSISESPDTSFLVNEQIERSKLGTIIVNPETYVTNQNGVFAGGDVVTGPNTVVDAVASGKIAARSINQYLNGKEIKREYTLTRPSGYIEPMKLTEKETLELITAHRPVSKQISVDKRIDNFSEVETGLTEKQAVKEAKRCLHCELQTEDGKLFLKELHVDVKH